MADEQVKVSFMAPKALMDKFESIAAEEDRTVSAELRRVVRIHVEKEDRAAAA